VVRLERGAAVAVIVIDNPPVNAGSRDVRNGIVDSIRAITRGDAITSAVFISFRRPGLDQVPAGT
jgi:3-hydroxyacyl-CoA dehydrogenase